MLDHYKNKQDATHQAYRTKHGSNLKAVNSSSSAGDAVGVGSASSSTGVGGKRPMPPPSAPSKKPAEADDEPPMEPVDLSEYVTLCSVLVPKETRLSQLRKLLERRVQQGARTWCDSIEGPNYSYNASYSQETADLGDVPADPVARAALAEALVTYGEAVDWKRYRPYGTGSSYWRNYGTGQPSGPPLVADLVELAESSGKASTFSYPTGVALEACRLLHLKGLSHRGDLQSGNPSQAGPGLYSIKDSPLVKYARAGSVDMVAALLVAGAEAPPAAWSVDQCMVWDEDDGKYYWRGDSALMAAARKGHKNVCAVLLRFGANKLHKCTWDEDSYDDGCAAAARRCGQPEVAAFLEGYKSELPDDPLVDTTIQQARAAMALLHARRGTQQAPAVEHTDTRKQAEWPAPAPAPARSAAASETSDQKRAAERARELIQELSQLLPQVAPAVRDQLFTEIDDMVVDAEEQPGGGRGYDDDYDSDGYGGGYGGHGGYGGYMGGFGGSMGGFGAGGGRHQPRDWSQPVAGVERTQGRFGAILRGEFVLVIGEVLFGNQLRQPYHIDSSCSVAVCWKDERGYLHADHEKADRGGLGEFIDTIIASNFDAYAAQMYDDYEEEDGYGAHLEPSAQDLPNGIVDKRVWRLCNRGDSIAQLWQAVRVYMEATRAGTLPLPPDELPPCLHTFLSGATPGRLIQLLPPGSPQTTLADDAMGPGRRCRWGAACARIDNGCNDVHSFQEVDLAARCGLTAALEHLGGQWAQDAQQ